MHFKVVIRNNFSIFSEGINVLPDRYLNYAKFCLVRLT